MEKYDFFYYLIWSFFYINLSIWNIIFIQVLFISNEVIWNHIFYDFRSSMLGIYYYK